MDFGVLGPLEVRRDGVRLEIGSRMQRRLLTLLLINAGASVSAERAIDVLWAGDPPASAAKGLHTYVSRLRQVLGAGDHVESGPHGYRLSLGEHELDARRFEQLVSRARERLTEDPAEGVTGLAEALALWRGPAYDEFSDEDFARPEAVRLDELRLAATEDAFTARLAIGDPRLISDLEAHAIANPLRERPHALLMSALGQAGRPTEALEVYQWLRARLADEVGLEPSPALQRVQADILHQASNVMPTVVDETDRHPGELPPGSPPQPVTSFIGRHHESEAVCRLLDRHHLVTLTGVGGVGKTRLALQVAAAVSDDYPDGVRWCELAPVDSDAVTHAVADILGVYQQANRSITDSILNALSGKRLLLVLDNCEHLVEASAKLAEHVLRRCPGVTILTTSREPLAVDGEQVWLVPPLPLPSDRAGEGVDAPSAQLFLERATSHHADFSADAETAVAVADICRQLDGLPLAIELAAALVPALEPAEIAHRLGHRFRLLTRGSRTDPRHRSLAAVVEWSYQLLDPDEQRLFERLAVFAGGFTLAAAEGVCADERLTADRIVGLLASLVSHSMVGIERTVSPARYRLLETLRQYAGEKLSERGEGAALRARHADWFVDLAERADEDVRGPDEAEAVALLETELANLRAAHRFAVDHGDADLALRLSAALYVYARFRLRDEVFLWAEEAAELPAAAGHRLQSMVRGVAAHGISNRGELTRAREIAERALTNEPDVPGLFAPLRVLATIALYEGRLEDCRRHSSDAIASARREGDGYYLVWMQMHEVFTLVYGRQRQAGLEAALEQRTAADELGNPNLRAWALYGHAEACGDNDPEKALELLEEAIAMAEPIRGRYLEGVARVAMASLRARHQSPHDALASFPDLIEHWRRLGDWTHQWTTLRNLVPLLVRVGADEAAARLHGAQRSADTAAPVFGDEADRLAEVSETLVSRLGASAFGSLAEQGERLSGEEATALALTTISDALRAEGSED